MVEFIFSFDNGHLGQVVQYLSPVCLVPVVVVEHGRGSFLEIYSECDKDMVQAPVVREGCPVFSFCYVVSVEGKVNAGVRVVLSGNACLGISVVV